MKYFPNWLRLFLLKIARKIVEREGLTCADIRTIAGTTYIVDFDNRFYKVSAAPNPEPKVSPSHNLKLIK
jgi:hypothetical protein